MILDNATFHHGGRIAQLIEAVGCQLIYLPPYSPDLNRIEKCWAWLQFRHLCLPCSPCSLDNALTPNRIY